MMNYGGNGRPYSGHRVSKGDQRQRNHQKHESNGSGHRRGEFNENGSANPLGNVLGGQIKPANTERSEVLRAIQDIEQFSIRKKYNFETGHFYYEDADPQSPLAKAILAILGGELNRLNAENPEPGVLSAEPHL